MNSTAESRFIKNRSAIYGLGLILRGQLAYQANAQSGEGDASAEVAAGPAPETVGELPRRRIGAAAALDAPAALTSSHRASIGLLRRIRVLTP